MIPVAIVGGGPVGLVTSIYLSRYGIEHVLYERHPGTAIHPKAVGLNQRSMEMFRLLGLEKDIEEICAPKESYSRTSWYTNFGPHGREIVSRDAWGGGQYREEYRRASPCKYNMLPQIRLEPILLKKAKELNKDGIMHNALVVTVKEGKDSVRLDVQFSKSQKCETIDAQYVIGADGGQTVEKQVGINVEGEQNVINMASIHMRAPISKYHPDPRSLIVWFLDPARGGSINTGYLYHVGPYPMKSETEEWMFACARIRDDPEKFEVADMMKRVRDTLQIPDLDIQLIRLNNWFAQDLIAERFRSQRGRVFLAGDAAHRMPPWGALTINTGLQDVPNLAWKLAMVLAAENQEQYDTLLDSYEEERRPIALRVLDVSRRDLRNHYMIMDRALGIDPKVSAEENIKKLAIYLDHANGEGDKVRDAVNRAQAALNIEFHAPGLEIGWFYPCQDVDGEGEQNGHGDQLDKEGNLDALTYHPSSISGHHMPHFWLQKGGITISTRDLILPHKCVLFAKALTPWESMKSDFVQVEMIDGNTDSEKLWHDVEGGWTTICNLDYRGAILVRPDGIIIWRAKGNDDILWGSKSPTCFEKFVKQRLRIPDSRVSPNIKWNATST